MEMIFLKQINQFIQINKEEYYSKSTCLVVNARTIRFITFLSLLTFLRTSYWKLKNWKVL